MAHPSELFDLSGRVAIVTGSTRGIGRAVLEGLSQAGASVVVSSRRQSTCDEVAAQVRASGGKALGLACHVGDWDAIPHFVESVVNEYGRIDILVNNAGINPAVPTLNDVTLDLWRKVFSVNVEGPMRMSQCVAPVMRDHDGGSIINVGSMEGYYSSNPVSVVYAASKAALHNLTKSMANLWASWRVRANLLCPGPFATEMLAEAERVAPGALTLLADMNPQHRIADLSEIVGPALYLASDASSFVTGDDITVSGGMRK
ncbi:dehydrogenase [Mycolicibacterium celeriflavum]|uniref:SDR family NAD(P)-dependent oxidoreductase n=1 Tax=Mycolicibacterium celeriflavum TaxID=1249101 RepID=UPI0007FB8959|nr:glucose 1-dehydrogenase [Mycolicibacterium celeriflavum]MCV7236658.1 glucose 1-dehydrogenase [Mycolicibacterium celeriflavum]OBG16689.1 dehydrogenase [Mycolicibacterium celeriflavum]ORA42250.1 dehydrogenase [Mycolicibacterium celeriflavum]